MRVAILLLSAAAAANAFVPLPMTRSGGVAVFSTAAEEPVAAEPAKKDKDIPKKLPSDCGKDYVPLATMLATGDFKEADQVRRSPLSRATTGRRSRPSSFHLSLNFFQISHELGAPVHSRRSDRNLRGQGKGPQLCVLYRCQEHPEHRFGHYRASLDDLLGRQVRVHCAKEEVEAI